MTGGTTTALPKAAKGGTTTTASPKAAKGATGGTKTPKGERHCAYCLRHSSDIFDLYSYAPQALLAFHLLRHHHPLSGPFTSHKSTPISMAKGVSQARRARAQRRLVLVLIPIPPHQWPFVRMSLSIFPSLKRLRSPRRKWTTDRPTNVAFLP